ncbi:MAG: Gfo/Idh/MocA family oxidoreductase [Verrucomicrobiae bacterium]|nr:Gfo/Idh/MocA family oxidoreductase [Verrucomicrobiae bacterium]
MNNAIKVALIGLDTSHTVEFARRMQAPDCPPDQKVSGLRATACMRFPTPFQSKEGLDDRQKILEGWGIRVTPSFEEAVSDCDAVMLEINDPARHLEYFARATELGKRVFLDKPLADTLASGQEIARIAAAKKTSFFSASSLRFVPQLLKACDELPKPLLASTYGPVGKAPAGSSIVWYGVHAFEMLQRAMGRGAQSVFARADDAGVAAVVRYPEKRRGVVELSFVSYAYGGSLRDDKKIVPFVNDASRLYSDLLLQIRAFFRGAPPPVAQEDTLEVMALLDAAQRSADSGREEAVKI